MGQEFFINNQILENKIRELLPSQGGAGAGFDLSASTQIIPIVDVTESAEGSNVRADLQTAFSHSSASTFDADNATVVISNTTGYFRIFGTAQFSGAGACRIEITDGTTNKVLLQYLGQASSLENNFFDFIVLSTAGDTINAVSSTGSARLTGISRQIASLDGVLTSP